MSELSDRIAALSPERRLLFEVLRQERPGQTPRPSKQSSEEVVPVTAPFSLLSSTDRQKLPDEIEDAYPVGIVQLGMLFHMELRPDHPSPPAYHNVNTFHLRFPFEEEAFQRAVDHVVARHPALRTSFDLTTYSEPLQLVHKRASLPVKVTDLRHLPAVEQEKIWNDFIAEANFQLLDLTCPPLLTFYIHRLSDEAVKFTFIEPHCISDGWSTHLTLVEIFKHYSALLKHETPPDEPQIKSTYRDFIHLERMAMASEAQQRFWEEQLRESSFTSVARWPNDSGGEISLTDHKLYFSLPSQLIEGIKQVALQAKVPFKSVLLAAHLKVVSLISGQRDTTTGVAFNGRLEVSGGDQVRGLFLNILPFRFALTKGSWIDLLRHVYDTETAILPFRRFPLAKLQQSRKGQPLFEIGFSYHHFHSVEGILRSGEVEALTYGGSDLSRTNYPFMVMFIASADGPSELTQIIDYDVTEFCKAQIQSMYGYYYRVFSAMIADPTRSHDAAEFHSADDLRLLREWNNTAADYPGAQTIHQLFEAQVERTPDAIALIDAQTQMTYQELNQRANQLAHHLLRLGVRRETIVGICLDRSIEMVIGLLGILKAGGAYLPLDPSYPPARIDFLIEDAQVQILLTREGNEGKLAKYKGTLVYLDADQETIAQQSVQNPTYEVTSANLAYVLYTSGTTGTPKGVLGLHRGAVNRFQWMWQRYAFERAEVCCLKTSLNFADSVWEIFGPLLQGVPSVVISNEVIKEPQRLSQTLAEHQVTRLVLVPSLLRAILDSHSDLRGVLPKLKYCVTSGEALSVALLQRFAQSMPGTILLNLYGSSEVSADVTYQNALEALPRVPIGRPIANLQCYVLDAELRPALIGVPGELYIGGAGLARGYLNHPELTAEKFVPHPFSTQAGDRLFRSGDYARYLPDGKIEYLGRLDHQIQIHGFRVEPGEVELLLAQHPQVRQALVVAGEDEQGDKRLIAYLVLRHEQALSAGELQRFLREKLPDYMVPSAFVTLEALPQTPSGKVARHALPLPGTSRPLLESAFVAPRNELEEQLAELWAEVLGLEQVGIYDNFLELGGHSLMAIQVLSRLRTHFQIDLSLNSLLGGITIAHLAERIQAIQWSVQPLVIPPGASQAEREEGDL